MSEERGKIIVKEEPDEVSWYEIISITERLYWARSTEDLIYILIERLKEECIEEGKQEVIDSPGNFIEPQHNEGYE